MCLKLKPFKNIYFSYFFMFLKLKQCKITPFSNLTLRNRRVVDVVYFDPILWGSSFDYIHPGFRREEPRVWTAGCAPHCANPLDPLDPVDPLDPLASAERLIFEQPSITFGTFPRKMDSWISQTPERSPKSPKGSPGAPQNPSRTIFASQMFTLAAQRTPRTD